MFVGSDIASIDKPKKINSDSDKDLFHSCRILVFKYRACNVTLTHAPATASLKTCSQ